MKLTYVPGRKILLTGSIMVFSFATLLFAQLVSANSTGRLLPSSDGPYTQWTPKNGTAHYKMVDESTCNGRTDYNSTNTIGSRDSYGVSIASIPNGSTITAIEISPCASRSGSGGSATMNVFYRLSDVDSVDAGNYALVGTTPTQLADTTFSGLSHIKSSTSTLRVGAVLSGGTRGARLSRIAVVVTYIPFPTPSNLDVSNVSETQNNLIWTDNSSDEDGFRVERSLNNQYGPFVPVATTSANVVSYNDTELIADQTYYYRVQAFNMIGNSGYSNTAYAVNATVIPSDPTDLTATAITASSSSSSTVTASALLGWSQNSTNEEGFTVEYSTDGVSFTEIATKGVNATSDIDTELTPGTYYYRVRAFNIIGNSGYSNTASVISL